MRRLENILPKNLSLGQFTNVHGLGIVPIIASEIPDLFLIEPLEKALAQGTVRITETSEAGEVPFLFLENKGPHSVIVLDGEEVVGGKQNRIINTTLIILAHTTVKLPVSCVQAGRWRHDGAEFASGKSIFRAKSRAVQKSTVTGNLRRTGAYHADQGAVWNEVGKSLRELGVHSATADYREGREHIAHRIEEFVETIRPTENQIGAVFLSREGVLGLEMLATPVLFAENSSKIVRSFAFEVLDAPDLNRTSTDGARKWWDDILRCEFTKHPSPATGVDIRLFNQNVIGSGLIWNNVLAHFSCFPNFRQEQNRPNTRRSSIRERRRNMRSSIQD
ncbi:MAG TPA: hypothetical protein PK250_07605 [Syntrophobacter fumaroxidans]|nr:hypothetical protein [Syntrophobacter fumaroxidans]